MFIARLVGLILLIALAVLTGAYLLTRQARYLTWSRRILQFGLVFLGVVMVLYLAERLMLVI